MINYNSSLRGKNTACHVVLRIWYLVDSWGEVSNYPNKNDGNS